MSWLPRQDNVALIAVLEATKAPGRSVNGDRRQLVCVANTHVHSNPELTDVKLWQVRSPPEPRRKHGSRLWPAERFCRICTMP